MKHRINLAKILGTIHAYPTMTEAVRFAAGEWKKAHKPESLLGWAERFHAWLRDRRPPGSKPHEGNDDGL